ncbi:MAG: ABC transporter ATP-binding protein [Elusimicrobiota bacterium]|jgi:multiple sugar transport system ATP-binding protein|nr:ABC transporter ATP-binding protein [Elusimicrobiota bacterium]
MSRVILKNIYKNCAKLPFFQELNIDVEDQSFSVLTGPAGAGKSLVLRLIAGLEEPSRGDILIDDVSVRGLAPQKRDIAMVFQNFALYPNMTVFANMAFGLKIKGFKRKEILSRICAAAEMLNIEHVLGKYPKTLTKEQKQRTAIGRAIVKKPKLFLFDEPLANTDLQSRAQMRLLLKQLHKNLKATFIYATRDNTEALSMGDKISVFKDGFLLQTADNIEIYNNPSHYFTASFMGSPKMNFFEADILRKSNGDICLNEGSFEILASADKYKEKLITNLGQKAIVGIRPQHLHIKTDSILDTANSFKASVELIESFGREVHLHCKIGKKRVVIIKNEQEVKAADEIDIMIDASNILIFNMSDGARIV